MSTIHVSDELPRLLTGDASRAEVMAAAAHLRSCVDCQQELVSATVAHASLASAQRFAAELVAAPVDEPMSTDVPPAELPDLSAVFAQVRQEAVAEQPDAAPGIGAPPDAASPVGAPEGGGAPGVYARARSHRSRLAVAAAVAGLLIGAGGAVGVSQLTSSSPPSGTPVALAAFGVGTHPAQARLGSGRLTIDATSLPAPGPTRRYEVWLTNRARTEMQPVGWIGTNGKASLTVPADLATTFSAIEVSVQDVDAPSYKFSGTSVLRGSYRS